MLWSDDSRKRAAVLILLAAVPFSATASTSQSINDLARRYGFGEPVHMGSKQMLRSQYSTVVFTAGSRKLEVNKTLIWMNDPTRKGSRSWSITTDDSQNILDPLLRPSATVRGDDITTIVIDPGHGGTDSGAIGHRRVFEKRAVLNIARKTRDILKAQGLSVRLTRESDYFVPLPKRTQLAHQWGADLFVSIHLNASSNSGVSGIETYICTPAGFASTIGGKADSRAYLGNRFNKKNTLLAYYLHRSLLQHAHTADRGIKHARFEVLRSAPCPAVLVECGFISNKAEAGHIIDRSYRIALAKGIAKGIMSYKAKTTTP